MILLKMKLHKLIDCPWKLFRLMAGRRGGAGAGAPFSTIQIPKSTKKNDSASEGTANRAHERAEHNAIPLVLAAIIAVAIIVIGFFYLLSPERISRTFGLKPPATDADTRAWLRPKGIRDIAAGLFVLTMMLTADTRLVGIALLVEAVSPFGDMSIILGSGGSRLRAFSVHGVTCAVMLVAGLLLIHAI